MVKRERGKPKREATKRELSRWQRQKKRQRLVLGLGILIIVTALATIGAGWYTTQYQPLHQTVIIVNDASFDMNDYINMLKYYGKGQSIDYMYQMAEEVVKVMERNELIKQGAEKLDITVSNDEIDEELKRRDMSQEYRDLVRAEILVDKLRDEYFEHQVPLFAEQRHILVMFLESESQAMGVRARLKAGEDFAELASELSLDSLSRVKGGDLGWQPKDVLTELLNSSIPDEYAFNSLIGELTQPIFDQAKTKDVGYWLIKVLERNEDPAQARVQAILLGSEQEALEVKAQLEAGEDFATLAKEISQHQESKEVGGDLDWLTPGTMSSNFDDFAFNSEIGLGAISDPIRDDTVVTTGGYWLLQILDKDDNKQIADDDRNLLKAKALALWVSSLWADPNNKIESYLDNDKKSWAIVQALGS